MTLNHINIQIESLWPAVEQGHALATCTCGWAWEQVFHGNPADKTNPSAIASSDQIKAAVDEHISWHMQDTE